MTGMYSFIDTNLLKTLVDEERPKCTVSCGTMPEQLYDKYHIASNGSFSRSRVLEHIISSVKRYLPDPQGLIRLEIQAVRGEILGEMIIGGNHSDEYYHVADLLLQSTDLNAKAAEDKIDWKQVVALAIDYLAIDSSSLLNPLDPRLNKRDIEHFSAVKRLALHYPQMKYQYVEGRVKLSKFDICSISREIEQYVKDLSGPTVISCIFQFLEHNHQSDSQMERFHFSQLPDMSGSATQQVPLGYIFNLAVKHIRMHPAPLDVSLWKALIELSTDLAAALDVQTYSLFEGIFFQTSTQNKKLRRTALFDGIFGMQQTRYRDALLLLRNVFNWVNNKDIEDRLGVSIGKIANIHEVMLYNVYLRAQKHDGCNLPFTRNDLHQWVYSSFPAGEISGGEVDSYLNIAAHEKPEPNSEICSVLDVDNITVHTRPLIHLCGEKYTAVHPSIGSMGLYEEVFSVVRDLYPQSYTGPHGKAFEELVRELLRSHGLKVHHGIIYGSKRKRLAEVDALVETPDGLYIFECKAKDLSPQARAGWDVGIYRDLAWTLVHGQYQAMNVELLLRQNGIVELKDESGKILSEVELKGRTVDRLSVTLHDFASFQDKVLSGAMIQSMLGARYYLSDATDVASKRGIDDLNKYLKKIEGTSQQLLKLLGNSKSLQHRIWFLCWGHLCILADDINSENDFETIFRRLRSVTTGVCNFYREYQYARRTLKMK